MNDVVERVGQAIKAKSANEYAGWDELARAAIEAMREPSRDMLETVKPWPAHWPKDGPDYPARHAAYLMDQATARSDWQAMIDAALADASPDIGKEG